MAGATRTGCCRGCGARDARSGSNTSTRPSSASSTTHMSRAAHALIPARSSWPTTSSTLRARGRAKSPQWSACRCRSSRCDGSSTTSRRLTSSSRFRMSRTRRGSRFARRGAVTPADSSIRTRREATTSTSITITSSASCGQRWRSASPAFEACRCRRTWSGLYEQNELDGNPVIGNWSARMENFFVAAGFSGHGMMHAPAAGPALAELIVHGRFDTLDLSRLRLSPNRRGTRRIASEGSSDGYAENGDSDRASHAARRDRASST